MLYRFAESSDGQILFANELCIEDRHLYSDLRCPVCKRAMRTAIGEVNVPHFRHVIGEECADHTAQLIEILIERSIMRAKEENTAYPLYTCETRSYYDLAAFTLRIERDKSKNGRFRKDLILVGDQKRINIRIARRKSDLLFQNDCCNAWLVINATRASIDDVNDFRRGIDAQKTAIVSMRKRSAAGSKLSSAAMTEKPDGPIRSGGDHETGFQHHRFASKRSTTPCPVDRQREDETYDEFRARKQIHPWMKQPP